MPLPSTGALDFGSIQTEFGKTNPISLTEYYGCAPGLPASGAISVADFYSKKYKSYWMSTFAGPATYTDYGYGIAADSAGNVYIVGTSLNLAVVAKYNSSGVVQWQRSLGSTGTNTGYGIALDSSGNVFVVGSTDAQGAGLIDLILAKYNNSGVIQWQRRLGGASHDPGNGVAVDPAGNVYVVGYTGSQGAGGSDFLIAKYNTSGVIQWQRSLGGSGTENGKGIAVDSSGNVYVVGDTSSQGAGGSDLALAKFNTSGTLQWQRTFGGTGTEYGRGIAVDTAGNVYVVGDTNSETGGGFAILVAKFNSAGTIQWQRSLGGSSQNGYGVAVDSSGNVYIVGCGNLDVILAQYNTSGGLQWQRTITYSNTNLARGIALDDSNNIYIVGQSYILNGVYSYDIRVAALSGPGLLGTYNGFTYGVSSFTDSARTLSVAASTLTASAISLTDAASTLTDAASSLTVTTTTIV